MVFYNQISIDTKKYSIIGIDRLKAERLIIQKKYSKRTIKTEFISRRLK
jgi:hypothetical protein